MGGIAKQEQARAIPAWQTIRFDGEHRNLFPVFQFCNTASKLWRCLCNRLAQGLQSGCTDLLIGSLADDVADLPIIFAFEEYQGAPTTETSHQAMWIIGLA